MVAVTAVEPLAEYTNGFDLDPDVLHGRRSHDLAPGATRQSAA
jgi:hypothetical protein